MVVYIIGIALIGLAVGLFIGRKKQEEKLYQIKATETLTAAALSQEATDVAEGMGEKGSYNKLTEVKGVIRCDQPLTSELAQAQCVNYSMSVTRKWEEKYWEKDSNGNQVQKTRQGSDVVASNERSVPFYVQDATGKMKINPEGAEMIREKSYSQFVPGDPRGPSVQIGKFKFDFGSVVIGSGRRTVGYSYEESIIPLNKDIYVLGEATDSGGELKIQKPSEKGKRFIISVKSEEELKRSISGAITGLLVGSIISVVAGVALIVLNIFGVFTQ